LRERRAREAEERRERWRNPIEACWEEAKARVKKAHGWSAEHVLVMGREDERLEEELLAVYAELLKRRDRWPR